jgi:hypothetical protein
MTQILSVSHFRDHFTKGNAMQRTRQHIYLFFAIVVALLPAQALAAPSEASLKEAFFKQIQAVDKVSAFKQVDKNTVPFVTTSYGNKLNWSVHVQKVGVSVADDAMKPYSGSVVATWTSNGTLLHPGNDDMMRALIKTLNFNEARPAYASFAYWGERSKRWNW